MQNSVHLRIQRDMQTHKENGKRKKLSFKLLRFLTNMNSGHPLRTVEIHVSRLLVRSYTKTGLTYCIA